MAYKRMERYKNMSKYTPEQLRLKQLEQQIANTETRLDFVGEDRDPRNVVERLFNLPEKQNFLFDILEVIQRPFQAVTNIASTVINPHDVRSRGEAAWEGLSGKNKVYGSDLLDQQGVEGWRKHVGGLAIDVLLDPITYIPGAQMAKAGRLIGRGAKAVTPAPVRRAVKKGADTLGSLFKTDAEALGRTLDGGWSNAVAKLQQEIRNMSNYGHAKISEDLLKAIKGLDVSPANFEELGKQVARIMEDALVQFEKYKQFVTPEGLVFTEAADFRKYMKDTEKTLMDTVRKAKAREQWYIKQINKEARQVKQKDKQLEDIVKAVEKEFNLDQALTKAPSVLSSQQQQLLKELERTHNASKEAIQKQVSEKVIDSAKASKRLQSERRKYSVERRKIIQGDSLLPVEGGLTPKELENLIKRLKTNYKGKQVFVEGIEGTVQGTQKGKVVVRFADGSESAVTPDRVIPKYNVDEIIQFQKQSRIREMAMSKAHQSPEFVAINAERMKLVQRLENVREKHLVAEAERLSANETMRSTMKLLNEMLKEPMEASRVIERVKQMASNDPKLRQAAQVLIEGNEYLLRMATELGVDIGDMSGYMAHVLTQDALEFMGKRVLSSGKHRYRGNPNVIKGRTIPGSVEEINIAHRQELIAEFGEEFVKEYGYNMFEPNAFIATMHGQQRVLRYILAEHAHKTLLNNPDFARPLAKGEKFVPIDGLDLVEINSANYRMFAPDNMAVDSMFSDGQRYVVTKGVKKVLDQFQDRATDEGIRAFMKGFDKVNTLWKKLALFSAGFHIRNHLGNNFNMWIYGMSPNDLVKFQADAAKIIRAAKKGEQSEIYTAFRKQGLRESSVFEADLKTANAEEALRKKINAELDPKSRLNPARWVNAAFDKSRDFGTGIDEHARLALFKWAMDTGKAKTYEEAAAIVREVLFDYSKLTPFERQVKNFIPFYTWTRNNVPFQLKNFLLQPGKYARVDKARQAAFGMTGIDQEDSPEWLEESFAFPVYGDGSGSGSLLGLNLPVADLTQLGNPFKMMTDSLTPLIKAPIEFGTNIDFFRGEPLERFKGETVSLGGVVDVPKRVSHVINQLGAVRNLANHTRRIQEGDWFNFLTGNLFKELNKEQAEYFRHIQTLNDLQDAMQRYKQRYGELPPTLSEIGR